MANYSTVSEVRSESGFSGDSSVPDELIQTYMDQATGIVLSHCAAVYNTSPIQPGTINTSAPAHGLLKRSEILIASGYLLIKLYGGEMDGDKDGYDKINEGKALVMQVSDKKAPLRLVNESGSEYGRNQYNEHTRMALSTNLSKGGQVFNVSDKY